MNPALMGFIGALVGAVAALAGTVITGFMTGRREQAARRYDAKAKVYACLLEHIDHLRATAFSDHVAFAAYTKNPEKLLLARQLPWYLDMEVRAPEAIRTAADKVINALHDLGGAREDAWYRLGADKASTIDIETDAKVEAEIDKFNARRKILLELIREDLGA